MPCKKVLYTINTSDRPLALNSKHTDQIAPRTKHASQVPHKDSTAHTFDMYTRLIICQGAFRRAYCTLWGYPGTEETRKNNILPRANFQAEQRVHGNISDEILGRRSNIHSTSRIFVDATIRQAIFDSRRKSGSEISKPVPGCVFILGVLLLYVIYPGSRGAPKTF